MLRIKLIQTGRNSRRSYRIVVQERREKREGNVVEQLGSFSSTPTSVVKIDRERLSYWTKVGARPTAAVAKLVGGKD